MMRPEVEDVPELMQHIQSRLPVTEAARTSVLSKSWLHAWSTIPTLRFDLQNTMMNVVDVDRTLTRYLRDNTPIERFELRIYIENQEEASHAEKWIGPVASKTCLREISLSIFNWGASFMLPNEILANENLTKIRVTGLQRSSDSVCWMTTPVINCVSLRELHLEGCVHISEEMLHDILTSCSLLLKIRLLGSTCKGFKTLKVKNLPRLYELQIALDAEDYTALEISDVPNLGVFSCDQNLFWESRHVDPPPSFNVFSISIGSSLTHIMLGGLITDNTCLDIFKSEFHFLEILTLHLTSWMLGSFNLTCASIKTLSLLWCPHRLINVQVHAPKLDIFKFGGLILPSLLFPVSSLEQMNISLSVDFPLEADYFLKMREALTLSRYCNLSITTNKSKLSLDIDIDDLRTRLLFPPARNVQLLSFETTQDECLWERSPFFEAFFEICHPKIVLANPDMLLEHKNHFCRVMLREVLDKKTTTGTTYWPHYLKQVQIRHKSTRQQWKTLTNSHRSLLDGSATDLYVQFKLKWQL